MMVSSMDNSSIFVSIIVPVYNVKDYIERCVTSILQQSYTNYELILVDDGSTDESGRICDELARKDTRIRVYHKPNGGLSDARNFAMKQASGDCYTFIDSDDYVATEYLETLVDLMCKYDADVSIVSYYSIKEENFEEAMVDEGREEKCVNAEEGLRLMLLAQSFSVSAWAKLYRRELFDDVQYPIAQYYEDLKTTPVLLSKCNRVAYSERKLYYYVKYRPESITNSAFNEKHWASWSDAMDQTERVIQECCPYNYDAFVGRYVKDLFRIVLLRVIYNSDHKEYFSRIRAVSRPRLKKLLKNRHLSIPYKVAAELFLFSPELCRMALLLLMKIMKNRR